MNNQKGFTLIELVVVIVILGILAAVAIPKFINIQTDARVATLKGAKGALVSAAAMAHAQQLVKGLTSSGANITLDGGDIVDMADGYPDTTGIQKMVTIDGFTESNGNYKLDGIDACMVSYSASASGAFPAVSVISSGCP